MYFEVYICCRPSTTSTTLTTITVTVTTVPVTTVTVTTVSNPAGNVQVQQNIWKLSWMQWGNKMVTKGRMAVPKKDLVDLD